MSDRIVLKWPLTLTPAGMGLEQRMLPGPVVAVAWQRDRVTLWIEHPIEGSKVDRLFVAVPTGSSFPAGAVHVGSAVSEGLVFHVYELAP